MIQAIGLTSAPRRQQRPVVDDLTFEVRSGSVTVLLGPEGAGKTSALRLLLQLQPGHGVALFNGRPVHRVPHPAREIGVLLGDVPGHPARTARGHLRMLSAVAGVPVDRADDVLDVVGLSGLADQRLGVFSLGMDRRLGIASALLGDPHTLVMDEPTLGLSPREAGWLHALLRGYAEQGGSVLVTCSDPKEAARLADRVVTVDGGRLVADQSVVDFARTRLRPRVAISTPHAERLAALLSGEARSPRRVAGRDAAQMEVVYEGGSRVSVYGSSCAEVGDVAHRNGILVHQLADETGDTGDVVPPAPLARVDGRRSVPAPAVPQLPLEQRESVPSPAPEPEEAPLTDERLLEPATAGPDSTSASASAPAAAPASVPAVTPAEPGPEREPAPASTSANPPAPPAGIGPAGGPTEETTAGPDLAFVARSWKAASSGSRSSPGLPPRLHAVARPGPAAPVRYELRRLLGVRTTWFAVVAAVLGGLALAVAVLTTNLTVPGTSTSPDGSSAPVLRLLAGWPAGSAFPLPPAALVAGFLGALAFGQEFRFPALAPAQASVPRRLGMLVAKLVVSAATALALCTLVAVVNAAVLTLFLGLDVLTADVDGAGVRGGPTGSGMPGAAGLGLQAVAIPLLCVGCAWTGLLAAGVFRSTVVGVLAVVAVPVLGAPVVRRFLNGPVGDSLEGLPARLEATRLVPWPSGADSWVPVVMRLASQPVGRALALSLTVLLCAYLFTSLRSRAR